MKSFARRLESAQRVERVIDGDTLVVRGIGTVRLIGVDTPETVDPRQPVQYFGKEASEFTRRLATGAVVRLEFDTDRRDRYGRTLAYVHLPDGTFLNAEIVKRGYGHAIHSSRSAIWSSSAATSGKRGRQDEDYGPESSARCHASIANRLRRHQHR